MRGGGCAEKTSPIEEGARLHLAPHGGDGVDLGSGSLSAQARYADGVREILECYFDGKELRNE